MRRDFLRLCLAAGLGLAVLGRNPEEAWAALRVGDVPPRVTLNDIRGNNITLPADFKGKVSLVHFWASWCTACRPEIAALETIFGKYRNKAVIPCSVNIGESRDAAESYIRNMKVTYPFLLDPKSSVVRQYSISGIPTTYVLDRESVIRFRIIGEINRDGLERLLRTLL